MIILQANPILKWAGGKTQLLDVLTEKINIIENKDEMTYIEPFIGAGALFINLASQDIFKNYIINDINSKLINVYIQVRDNPEELIRNLTIMRDLYLDKNEEERSEFYYHTRDKFNYLALKDSKTDEDKLLLATYFIFLNKTCFNGLYRENKKGEFNVPIGSYKNPSIFDSQEILALSSIFNLKDERGENRVIILNKDFDSWKDYVDENTFIYFDPPYRPVTKGGFSTYDKSGFNDKEQIRLAKFYRELDAIGAKMMLSNSDPRNLDIEDDFFDEIYKDFKVNRILAKRIINSKGSARGKVTEILVTNFGKGDVISMAKYEDYMRDMNPGKTRDEVFNDLISNLNDSIAGWDYYVDWEKINKNVTDVEIRLNLLDSLIYADEDNIVYKTKKLLKDYPEVITVIPIVLAVRSEEIKVMEKLEVLEFNFTERDSLSNDEIDEIIYFLEKIGLYDIILENKITSFHDYVFGVEVGLDTNARKNRTGTAMESIVEEAIKELCKDNNWEYYSQINSKGILEKTGIQIPVDISDRSHDFVIHNKDIDKILIIEVNYYSGGGSKLKAVAGEFSELNEMLMDDDIAFCWITDGKGWQTAINPLNEAFNKIPYIFNLKMLDDGHLEYIVKNL